MRSNFRTKQLAAVVIALLPLTSASQAVPLITGVADGYLSGGNPKSIIPQAAAPVADLTLRGVGPANNGGGMDGEEFTLPPDSIASGSDRNCRKHGFVQFL